MPLPTSNIPWPPPAARAANDLYEKCGAWYSGDPDRLTALYGNASPFDGLDRKNYDRPGQHSGGLVGKVSRFFWGSPTPRGQARDNRLHIPLAGDIAATSADLLLSEPPAFVFEDDTTQARMDTLLSDGGLYATLLEAAELASAYGDAYLRVTWNTTLADHPLVDALPGDVAVPEFQSGILRAVTFWKIVHEDRGEVWRHLERHEPGRVLHGLYKGDGDKLGRPMPLQDNPETEEFATQADANGAILTGARGLTAEHIPNMKPHRLIRGSALGRSDYSPAVMRMMDSLDETYSSWMRDIRLAKARLIVPAEYLQNHGPGRGASFDPDRELYEAVQTMGDEGGRLDIVAQQFAIRVQEHSETATDLTARIVRGAGYSVQTFGEHGDVAATATEVIARERRSYTTRSRKIVYVDPPLGRFTRTLLEIDARVYKSGVQPDRPGLEWPDGVAIDPKAAAETIELLARAEAISIETKVKMLHPGWEDAEVMAEVEKIRKDGGMADPEADLNAKIRAGDSVDPDGPPPPEQ